jgi:glycosyltransferase involved in cell wall biosynthesis
LGIGDGIRLLGGLVQSDLVALYQHAAVVLMTSESEGFGIPLIEALACGSIIAAIDIPVLREVGGNAAVYCPVGTPEAWAETISELLTDPQSAPDRVLRLQHVKQYTWSAHAGTIAQAYRECILGHSPFQSSVKVLVP